MIFGKRRWATAVAVRTGLEPKSAAGQAVVNLLTVGSKKAHRLAHADGPRGDLDDLDYVMMAGRALPYEASAAARIEKATSLPADQVARLLAEVAAATQRLYLDEGRDLSAPRPGRAREPWFKPAKHASEGGR